MKAGVIIPIHAPQTGPNHEAPTYAEVKSIARELHGRADARGLDAVMRAVVDLPYAAIRRYGRAERLPSWLEADVRDSARVLLERI